MLATKHLYFTSQFSLQFARKLSAVHQHMPGISDHTSSNTKCYSTLLSTLLVFCHPLPLQTQNKKIKNIIKNTHNLLIRTTILGNKAKHSQSIMHLCCKTQIWLAFVVIMKLYLCFDTETCLRASRLLLEQNPHTDTGQFISPMDHS